MNHEDEAMKMAVKWNKKFGDKAGAIGNEEFPVDVIPTGSLALDYALGTGGWFPGHPIELHGPPDIGKTSILGYSALRNAQAMNKFCAIIAIEPGYDKGWASKHGIDNSKLLIGRPNNGLEAFQMLADCIDSGVGFVLFDSIGALLREAEAEADGKPATGGRSGLITWGASNILMRCWKKQVCVMYINQIRDDMKARVQGVVDTPGGHALKHTCAVRVQLKQGDKPLTEKVNGEDIETGRTMAAVIKRNKLSEGSKRRAEFDYYIMQTDKHGVGIDVAADIINTGMMTGVIRRAGAYYSFRGFPKDKNGKQQLQGREAVEEFLLANDEAREMVREDVLAVMVKKQGDVLDVHQTEEGFTDED